MLGRAIFGRPWLFDESKAPTLEERLHIAVEHAKLFEELLGDSSNGGKSFAPIQKHLTKGYAQGFPSAKELRVELMETENVSEVETIIERFLKSR